MMKYLLTKILHPPKNLPHCPEEGNTQAAPTNIVLQHPHLLQTLLHLQRKLELQVDQHLQAERQ